MAEYNGWTEVREYRVWMAEDTYAVVTVAKHRNGWFHVYEDGGEDKEYKTRDERYAFHYASGRADDIHTEALDSCKCAEYGDDDCEDAARNVYGDSHGVRTQVVDMIENRSLDQFEL